MMYFIQTNLFIIFVLLIDRSQSYGFYKNLDNVKVKTRPVIQQHAVKDLVERLLGEKSSYFDVKVQSVTDSSQKDYFKITKYESNNTVQIIGSSGVAVAWGFHHYLKYYCKCHVSWEADQLNLPEILPAVNLSIVANDRFRYYQNVCTSSYSFVWWNWERWERELDWMALNGFNLALAFVGQEEIWRRVYTKLNLTQEEIDEHFTGPAFFAWGRMGNIRGWGGPLSFQWHNKSLVLQNKILFRMRQLGIIPVLPAFSGYVPRAFKRIFPGSNMTLTGSWNNFNDSYCCPYLISPDEDLFQMVGEHFMREMISEFGTNHIYNCDTFNEIIPASGDLNYIAQIGKSVFASMVQVDPDAVWMLQGWMFGNSDFWDMNRTRALLTSVDIGRIIVLDLMAELNPQYKRYDSFFGQPFIWCMLHNFGGTLGMHGTAKRVNENVFLARNMENSTLVGTGIAPEGINQNYIIYDLMNEMAWRTESANLTHWFTNYTIRRYGKYSTHMDRAWQYLKDSVYNYSSDIQEHGKYILVRVPSLRLTPDVWYDTELVFKAWAELHKAISSNDNLTTTKTFLHDCVDISRQALQLKLDIVYSKVVSDFRNKDLQQLLNSTNIFLWILSDLETLLGTNKAFLLSQWLNSAKNAASSDTEKELFEMIARNQITLWGPNGEIKDYANKQWSGLVATYYYPRWDMFFSMLKNSLLTKQPYNQSAARQAFFKYVEQPFTTNRDSFPPYPLGNTIKISQEIYHRWNYL
uniref:Alpha-N-acetylglucosaminidase n=3 Tax=Clastoptera arizonana TaxID=38151 RepID=A0A1B6CZE1_9HEMI